MTAPLKSYTKEDQTKKNRKINPKRMTRTERDAYETFIDDKQRGKCFCGCGRQITEYHHAEFGINKDDRYMVGIAQHPCHHAIHHGKDIEEKKRLISLSKRKAKENWKDYNA